MYTVNPNWAKWILISAIKHFKEVADSNDIYFHIPNSHRDTSSQNRFVEFKMDGPIINQICRNEFKLLVGISILYSTDISDNYQDEVKIGGIFASSFTDICIYSWGDGDQFVGTLKLRQTASDKLVINNFGEAHKDIRTKQGSIEGIYEIHLRN